MDLTAGIDTCKKILECVRLQEYLNDQIQTSDFTESTGPFTMAMLTLHDIIRRKYSPNKENDHAMESDEFDFQLSGSSTESVDEDVIKTFIWIFMSNSLLALFDGSAGFQWLSHRFGNSVTVG